jgi:hypothetical protein
LHKQAVPAYLGYPANPLEVGATFVELIILAQVCDVHYVHRVNGRKFEFDTVDFQTELREPPLTHPMVRKWLQEFIAEGEQNLRRQSQ